MFCADAECCACGGIPDSCFEELGLLNMSASRDIKIKKKDMLKQKEGTGRALRLSATGLPLVSPRSRLISKGGITCF